MGGLKDKPLVYNIPAGQSFADSLAQGLLERAAGDSFLLSSGLVLLPSRRACRTLRDAFLRLSGGEAILLPRLQPIGDVDAEEVSMLLSTMEETAELHDIPPAISRLERQILLARLIEKEGRTSSFDQAAALALDLGKFLDEVQTERLSFDALAGLVPEEFAGHWQKTLSFLKILTENWPKILEERGVIDYAVRRNLLLEAQVRLWRARPPSYPVIAAGSTGTVPAARDLLTLAAHLPQGMAVLPGLDLQLDDKSWEGVEEDHPQYNMKTLLAAMEATRADVQDWPLQTRPRVNVGRVRLLSEAMRPADTTEKWRSLPPDTILPQALDGLARVDCATPQEEADVIALILRGVLETPGKTAALITPDRRLARRVTLSLRRWGIAIDDSGGQPLTEHATGAFLMLIAEAVESGFAPVSLLALLKHPLLAASMPAEDLHAMVRLLDRRILRGPRPGAGIAGLRVAISSLGEAAAGAAAALTRWLDMLEPLVAAFAAMMTAQEPVPFRTLLDAHMHMAESLAATLDETGVERLWRGGAGDSAAELFHDLLAAAGDVPSLLPRHYIALLANMLKGITVRPHYGAHPRLSILGQIEARLYCADLVVLGGLNEGTWPDLPAHDPWMSRQMRKRFGLPSPERSLSLAAHDFVQAASAPEVVITRAGKVDGTPTVPARWLLRLDAVLAAVGLSLPQKDATLYRQWRQDMDSPVAVVPALRPAPRPPVAARPRKLSVTRIEAWMRDPYQIYAQYVLGLRALDPVDADAGGAERGTFIHAALEEFIQSHPGDLPADATAVLERLGRKALEDLHVPPEVEAFWWPRFLRVAQQFIMQERDWRQTAHPCVTEVEGRWTFPAGESDFTLTGKADRIDRHTNGTYAIIDYKSGSVPRKADVLQGLSPQLPLEALMLERGAFEEIPSGIVETLLYWQVTGAGQEPVRQVLMTGKNAPAEDLIADAEAGLQALVKKFDDPETPYISQPDSEARPAFSDYNHLARVKEWGLAGEDEDGGGEVAA